MARVVSTSDLRSTVIVTPDFTSVRGGTWGQVSSLFPRQCVQPDKGLVAGVK